MSTSREPANSSTHQRQAPRRVARRRGAHRPDCQRSVVRPSGLAAAVCAGLILVPATGIPASALRLTGAHVPQPVTGSPTAAAPLARAGAAVAWGRGTRVPPSGTPVPGAGSPAGAQRGKVRKILVIVEENHTSSQVFPRGMPYLWHLARQYGYAAAWQAIGHPSLPNYLAIFGGSSFRTHRDCNPGLRCLYPGPSVFGQALALGKTARAYQESMPRPCDPRSGGEYDVHHNPWAYFSGEIPLCRAGDVPAGGPARGPLASDVRAGRLPTVGLVTPNLIHDGHDGSLRQADTWLRGWVPVLQSGPDWRSGRVAIIVVFDEGNRNQRVPFVLVAPHVSGAVLRRPADHYALTRLIDSVIGAQPLRDAARAPSIALDFGL